MSPYIVSIPFVALFAGLMQGITGMGSGMLLMMLLPLLFPVAQAAAVSGAICLFLTASMLLRYRKHINYHEVIIPTAIYILSSAIAIHFAISINAELFRKVFGAFLIILALFLILKKDRKTVSYRNAVGIMFVVISGICDGLFGIGSPLMVLYFTGKTQSKEEYLGTIQFLFFFSLLINTSLRFFHHLIGWEHLPFIALGVLGILAGLRIAICIVGNVDSATLKKFAYAAIGLSGIYNLFF